LLTLKRLFPFLALLVGCSGSRSGAPDAIGTPAARAALQTTEGARSIPIVALRVLAGGGALRAYLLPALKPADWALGGRTSPVATVIGMDDAGRRLIYRDSTGRVAAFDLVAYRERPVEADSVYVGREAIMALSPDGTLYAVLPDGTVIESAPWGASAWPNRLGRGVRDAFAGVSASLIAIRHATADTLALASREAGISLREPVPSATACVASRDGDAVAFATDSGLVVVEEREPRTPWYVHLKDSPVAAAFTPSGHRVYVALKTSRELAVVDRFTRGTLASIALPGPAGALRMDPWGRAVLVHRADPASDETWIVSVADNRLSGRLSTRWASDLPTAAEDGALLVRRGPTSSRGTSARSTRSGPWSPERPISGSSAGGSPPPGRTCSARRRASPRPVAPGPRPQRRPPQRTRAPRPLRRARRPRPPSAFGCRCPSRRTRRPPATLPPNSPGPGTPPR